MSVDYIKAQLTSFKLATIASKKEVEQFCHESPFLRTKREVQEELARAEKYRAAILKTLTTFSKFHNTEDTQLHSTKVNPFHSVLL